MSTVEVNKGAPPHDPTDPTRDGGHGQGHGDGHDELPHLPPPSVRPLVMSIGLLFASYGLVFLTTPPLGLILLLIGLAIFGYGLGGWIYDDVRAAREFNASGGHGGHH